MNLRKKITGFALGLALMLGAGGVFAANGILKEAVGAKAAEDGVVYTLTPTKGSNNNYAAVCDVTIDKITWNLAGNSQLIPWRIGGKSITGVDRSLYSKTPIADNVSKIDITFGTASSITVNSFTVSVHDTQADSASGANAVATATPTFKANSTISVERPEGDDWSGKYYRMTLNVTVSGSSNKYVEFTKGVFYGGQSSKPSVSVTNKQTASIEIGSTGTYVVETENATNAVITWASSDSEVFDVAASTGAYEAKGAGVATVTASMICDESPTTPITVSFEVVVNAGLITIEEANAFISNLSGSTATAAYEVTVHGYIVNLDADSKNRMITISDKKKDETDAKTINVYGVYSDNALREKAIINGEVTVTGKPAKYNGSGQLNSPSFADDYTDDAIKFAQKFIADTTAPCSGSEDDKSEALAPIWTALKEEWDKLDSYAQAKLKAATSEDADSDIAAMAARYDQIVNKYSSLNNFINRTVTPASAAKYNGIIGSDANTLYIVLVAISVIAAIGGITLFRRRKHQ